MAGTDRRGTEDSGQMLLLTAIILAIGFIALASMAARIDQIPDEAGLIQEGIFFDEVGLVVDAVGTASDGLAEDAGYELNTTFKPDLEAALAHLVLIEGGRGYYLQVGEPTCSAGVVKVAISLASVQDEVILTVSRDYSSEGPTCF